jgi:hypothetical protein
VDDAPSTGAQPLLFRNRLSETDAVNLLRCRDRLLFRRSIRWLAGGFVTFLAALCLGSILIMGPYVVSVLWLVTCVALLFTPFERTWQARRHYRRHVGEYRDTQISLSEDRVAIENDAVKSEFRWQLVGVIADTPAGLLFCNSARQALIWLPARLVEGNGLREQILKLAESKGVRVQRLT